MSIINLPKNKNLDQNTDINTVGFSNNQILKSELLSTLFINNTIPEHIIKTLLEIYNEDQKIRKDKNRDKMVLVDQKNHKILLDLLPELEKSDWNEQYNIADNLKLSVETFIRLIIQHADNNVSWQQQILQKYGDKFSPQHRGYLQDRIAINTKTPQIYGTQYYTDNLSLYLDRVVDININWKTINHTENGYKYIELTEDDIKIIDTKRKKVYMEDISWYYKSSVSISSLQYDGKIKMLIDYIWQSFYLIYFTWKSFI